MILLSGGILTLSLTNANATGTATTTVPSVSGLDAQLFASQVETLGTEQYASSFAGAQFQSNGFVTIYTSGADAALENAVSGLDKGGVPYGFVTAPLSEAQLEAEIDSVAAGVVKVQDVGLHPVVLNPDAATGQIDITLAAPSTSDLSELDSAIVSAGTSDATVSNYLTLAQEFLSKTFANSVYVEPTFSPEMGPAASRSNDSSHWTGGDPITGPNGCTSGFGVTGNASGNTFVLTAGHCGNGSWYTSAGTFIGNTSPGGLHYLDSAGNDYQTILTASARGRVWYSNTAYHPIIGYVIPAVGAAITYDGANTGEVPGSTVTANNATVDLYTDSGVYIGYISHQVEAGNTVPVCQHGDSGGPMYQRISGSSSVYAVAIIDSCIIDPSGPGTGLAGTGQRIDTVLSASNSSLILGP
jgi:hypothetical protein